MPPEMKVRKGTILKVIRPLYAIHESGFHWYLPYLDHHIERLKMRRTTVEPCSLIQHIDGNLYGIIILDIFGTGTEKFLKDEDEAAKNFREKPRTTLSSNKINFNRSNGTHSKDTTIKMRQKNKIGKITSPDHEKLFISERDMMKYIGTNTSPEICACVQLLVPGV